MAYSEKSKEWRYKYEKENLKRVALDLNKEKEYNPLKEYCDTHNIPVSRLIRDLIKEYLEEHKED